MTVFEVYSGDLEIKILASVPQTIPRGIFGKDVIMLKNMGKYEGPTVRYRATHTAYIWK